MKEDLLQDNLLPIMKLKENDMVRITLIDSKSCTLKYKVQEAKGKQIIVINEKPEVFYASQQIVQSKHNSSNNS